VFGLVLCSALADVPASVWDEPARPGLDTIWLMGVWERSPAGLEAARRALPDVPHEDVSGSPATKSGSTTASPTRRRRRCALT